MGQSAAALRRSLPALGGLLSLLAFIAAGQLRENRFPQDLFTPEATPRLAMDVLLFLLGMAVFITTTREGSARAHRLLFAASALLLAAREAMPYLIGQHWLLRRPDVLLGLIAEPGIAVAACALWGAATAQRSPHGVLGAHRFGRVCALGAATFLVLLLVQLGNHLYGIYHMEILSFPRRPMTAMFQGELFPSQIPTLLLAWACVENLRPSDDACRPPRLKRSQWALVGWFCASLFLSGNEDLYWWNRHRENSRPAALALLPTATFAIQALVTAFTAAVSLTENPAAPESPA